MAEAALHSGIVEPLLRDEFPGLALRYLRIGRGSGRSPREIKQRLAELSNRFGGPQAINLRHQPIPWAYRVFFRHIGLDPDEQPTPVEEVALRRMLHGGFKSENLLDDALTIAMAESYVPVRAFDAAAIEGRLSIRASVVGEGLEGRPGDLPAGTLVIADEVRPLSLLFGALAAGRGVHPKTEAIVLASVQVAGVPDIAVEEALWLAGEILRNG